MMTNPDGYHGDGPRCEVCGVNKAKHPIKVKGAVKRVCNDCARGIRARRRLEK